MAFGKLWVIAYRDLGRNRRRTVLTMIAVALGLAILILMSGFIGGVMDGSLRESIRLQTGHVQLRADSYEIEKMSLQWADLIDDSSALVAQAETMSAVQDATPVLWASGILSTIQETSGVQVTGIMPDGQFHQPIREGMVAGQYLTPDARGEILISKRLADIMDIGVGQRVSLAVGNDEGQPEEGVFTVRGLFYTGIAGYDERTVFMPLSQAQAFTGAGDRASAIVIMLHNPDDAAAVAAALQSPGITALTWEDMNAVLRQLAQTGMSFYYLMYGIVILVVAVIIANTLLMAVFERVREIGILAALGMKRRQIMGMFLLESASLALVGIVFGILLGSAAVAYLARVGIYIGEDVSAIASNIPITATMYTEFVPGDMVALSIAMLVVIVLASMYPAWFAARLQPVKALHSN
ncbi:MAG: ABC transporter permease [Anaerolineales bacterium]|jgi:ABC-type lipoprotein release transport system permease subunit